MIDIGEILLNLWNDSGFAALFSGFTSDAGWQNLVMLIISCVLLYLALVKKFEPLLLCGIAFGCLLTNIPGAGEAVNAPMPGNILKVNVTNGQAVKEGDVLVVLEAMKMENEIMAPKNGTVTQVLVQKGSTVDTGAPLVVIG